MSRKKRIGDSKNRGTRVPAPPPQIGSARELAKLTGIAKARMWPSHPGWEFGPPPWSIELLRRIIAWSAANLAPDRSKPQDEETPPGQTEDLAQALEDLPLPRRIELRGKLLRQRKDRAHVQILEKKFHSVSECELNQARIHREVVKAFQGLSARLQPGLIDEQRTWLAGELERICNKLAAGPNPVPSTPETSTSPPPGPTPSAVSGSGPKS